MGYTRTEEDDQLSFKSVLARTAGLTHHQCKNLQDEFGDLDTLERAHADEVKRVKQIGEKSIENIGIWDEDGEPVNTITRKPCPHCGEEYSSFLRVSGRKGQLPSGGLPDSDEEWLTCTAKNNTIWADVYFHVPTNQ